MTLLRVVVRVARRTGEYLFGIVFGTKAERTYGNNPHLRHGGAGPTSTEDFQAHLRAVSSSMMGGGAG